MFKKLYKYLHICTAEPARKGTHAEDDTAGKPRGLRLSQRLALRVSQRQEPRHRTRVTSCGELELTHVHEVSIPSVVHTLSKKTPKTHSLTINKMTRKLV